MVNRNLEIQSRLTIIKVNQNCKIELIKSDSEDIDIYLTFYLLNEQVPFNINVTNYLYLATAERVCKFLMI